VASVSSPRPSITGTAPTGSHLEDRELDDVEFLRQRKDAVVAYLHEEKIVAGSEATGVYNPNHAYGTVGDAIEYVERLIAAGADEIMFLHQMGTVPHEAIGETIVNIGKYVIPHFQS
jgi:hypothetical protein